MKISLYIVVLTVLATGAGAEEFKTLSQSHHASMKQLDRDHENRNTLLKKRYYSVIKQRMERCMDAGDLDGFLWLQDEAAVIGAAKPAKVKSDRKPEATWVKAKRDYLKIDAALKSNREKAREREQAEYLKELDGLVCWLTTAGRIEEAMAVNSEADRMRTSMRAEIQVRKAARFPVKKEIASKDKNSGKHTGCEKPSQDTHGTLKEITKQKHPKPGAEKPKGSKPKIVPKAPKGGVTTQLR